MSKQDTIRTALSAVEHAEDALGAQARELEALETEFRIVAQVVYQPSGSGRFVGRLLLKEVSDDPFAMVKILEEGPPASTYSNAIAAALNQWCARGTVSADARPEGDDRG